MSQSARGLRASTWTALAGVAAATAATALRPAAPSAPRRERLIPPDQVVFQHVRRLADQYDQARRRRLGSVRTPADWRRLAPVLRERFRRSFGEFPPRTPLNARVVGVLERSGYRIEKLVFESRPRLFVTANVYVPAVTPGGASARRFPAIIAPVGHWESGKAEPVVQAQCASLARKGFVVLVWDPLGQGERSQYWDPERRRDLVAGSTSQHMRLGNQAAPTGIPFSNYVVWDGVRALDYLSSRPDVDPDRIGCTGASGGGTLTMYLAVLDDRVKVAVPTLFVSSQHRWLATGIIADSEQVSFGWLKDGLDHPEWCALVAPRPLLLNAATEDFFPVQGTRETFAEARRIYELLGTPEAFAMRESAGEHQYTRRLRETASAWFLSRLGGPPAADAREGPFAPEPPSALWCTPSGRVALLGGTTVVELSRARASELAASHGATLRRWQEQPGRARREILDALAVEPPVAAPATEVIGSEDRADHRLTRLAYWSEPDVSLPASHFAPRSARTRRTPAALVIDAREGAERSDALARRLVGRGFHVLNIQPRGMGETRWKRTPSDYQSLLGDEATLTHDAWLLGTNLVGWRVRDIVAGLHWLRGHPDVDASRVVVLGVDPPGATPALLAAALDLDVARVALVRPLASYHSVAATTLSRMPASLIAWGVLRHFDLPHVAAITARRPLLLVNVVDASGETVAGAEAERLADLAVAGNRAEIIQGADDPLRVAIDWLAAHRQPRAEAASRSPVGVPAVTGQARRLRNRSEPPSSPPGGGPRHARSSARPPSVPGP